VIDPSISESELPRPAYYLSTDHYAQLLRERYPSHLIDPDPAKYVYGRHWPECESGARLGVVTVGVCLIFIFIRLIRHEKPAA